jgi:CRISPR system Cascade subunit CasC
LSIAALLEGLTTTSPTGKQASFASRSRASYVRVEKGSQQPRSLAAAFFKPIRGDDLLAASIARLEDPKTGLVKQMIDAYGPCFDAAKMMKFIAGEDGNTGSLPDLITFASE